MLLKNIYKSFCNLEPLIWEDNKLETYITQSYMLMDKVIIKFAKRKEMPARAYRILNQIEKELCYNTLVNIANTKTLYPIQCFAQQNYSLTFNLGKYTMMANFGPKLKAYYYEDTQIPNRPITFTIWQNNARTSEHRANIPLSYDKTLKLTSQLLHRYFEQETSKANHKKSLVHIGNLICIACGLQYCSCNDDDIEIRYIITISKLLEKYIQEHPKSFKITKTKNFIIPEDICIDIKENTFEVVISTNNGRYNLFVNESESIDVIDLGHYSAFSSLITKITNSLYPNYLVTVTAGAFCSGLSDESKTFLYLNGFPISDTGGIKNE